MELSDLSAKNNRNQDPANEPLVRLLYVITIGYLLTAMCFTELGAERGRFCGSLLIHNVKPGAI